MPTVFTTFEEEAKKLIDPNREKAKADSNAFMTHRQKKRVNLTRTVTVKMLCRSL